MKPIVFPRDEQAHNHIIEWWYFNGHLKGDDGRQYSFMDCFFRADVKKVKIPFLKIPLKTVHFSHSILTNITGKRFYPNVDLVSVISEDSFKRPLLYINYTDPIIIDGYVNRVIEEPNPFEYHIKTESFDLDLRATKPPLLEGGEGYLDLSGRRTYYYSFTNLEARGSVFINNRIVKVKGKAWMDHQWANTPYAQDKWTWFSIQLKDDTELVCFKYGEKEEDRLVNIVHPTGRMEEARDLKLTPTKRPWKSKKTEAEYHLFWKIEIPSKGIELTVEPLVKNQEMIFGSINYWEGPLAVKGKYGKKRVSGQGFLEVVGRQARYNSLRYLKDVFKEKLSSLGLKGIKRKK